MDNSSGYYSLIPVFSAIGGAAVVFISTSFNDYLKRKHEKKVSKEERHRKRIERLYELLTKIKNELFIDFDDAVSSMEKLNKIECFSNKYLIHLGEFEMIIRLYFPKLDSQRKKIVKSLYEYVSDINNTENISAEKEVNEEHIKKAVSLSALLQSVNKELSIMEGYIVEMVVP